MESRQAVVMYLRNLADKELAEVFYDAVRDRPASDAEFSKRHFVLADACFEDEKWSLDVIAREDPDEYKEEWARGAPVCEWGVCRGCHSQIRSWAKHMVCPVCGSKASGS